MLRRAVALTVLLLILSAAFLLPVSAASNNPFAGVSMEFPKGYQKLTRNNLSRNNSLVKQLGYTPSSLKDFMIKENIYYIGVGEDVDGEFHIKSWENELSKKANSFVGFTDESLAELNESLFGGNAEIVTVGKNDTVYFRTKSKVMEAEFYTFQYTTIEGGSFYSFIYYGDTAEEIDALMKTVRFGGRGSDPTVSEIVGYVITGAVIVLGIVAMGVIGIGILKDIKSRQNEQPAEETERIRIKRRKL